MRFTFGGGRERQTVSDRGTDTARRGGLTGSETKRHHCARSPTLQCVPNCGQMVCVIFKIFLF